MMNFLYKIIKVLMVLFLLCSASGMIAQDMIYYDETLLKAVKAEIEKDNPYFKEAYLDLLDDAKDDLNFVPNPVINKTVAPPSGDMHDYTSLAPYWWPDPTKPDGLPYIRRDGEVNPTTAGDDFTDQQRVVKAFKALKKLVFAYYFSDDKRYILKAKEIVKVMFIDEDTRMNPNVKYGQAVKGSVTGRPAGLIEFARISNVITAMILLERDSLIAKEDIIAMKEWFVDMSTWYTTHPYAIYEGNSNGNHANWYDYQLIGMYMYIGETEKARVQAEAVKINRIQKQIQPNGQTPAELGRTKSVHYVDMNIWAMTQVGLMAKKLGVDLLNYETADGRSYRRVYEFIIPYVLGEKTWTWKQITDGGAERSIVKYFYPTLSKASTILQTSLMPYQNDTYQSLSSIDILTWPPRRELVVEDSSSTAPHLHIKSPSKDTIITEGYEKLVIDVVAKDSAGKSDGIRVRLFENGKEFRKDEAAPFIWGDVASTSPQELLNLEPGDHFFKVEASNAKGEVSEAFFNIHVRHKKGSYGEMPIEIPGVLEVENYDLGGEGISYHDTNVENVFGAYRTDGVDIEKIAEGEYIINHTYNGEWLDYTVDVEKDGLYNIEATYATKLTTGVLGMELPSEGKVVFNDFKLGQTSTSNWDTYKTVTKLNVPLSKGIQVIRLNVVKRGYNFDKLTFTKVDEVTSFNAPKVDISVYPNPSKDGLFKIGLMEEWMVYDLMGHQINHGRGELIDLSNSPKGIYLLKTKAGITKLIR